MRLAKLLGVRSARKLAGRVIPGVGIAFNAIGNERRTRALADRRSASTAASRGSRRPGLRRRSSPWTPPPEQVDDGARCARAGEVAVLPGGIDGVGPRAITVGRIALQRTPSPSRAR